MRQPSIASEAADTNTSSSRRTTKYCTAYLALTTACVWGRSTPSHTNTDPKHHLASGSNSMFTALSPVLSLLLAPATAPTNNPMLLTPAVQIRYF
jgi:hypothetical protein